MKATTKLTPFIKWPGGKTKELSVINNNLPKTIKRYFEPFLGGGSVFLDLGIKESLVNDFSTELMDIYKMIKVNNSDFYDVLDEINKTWNILDIIVLDNKVYLEKLYSNYKSDFSSLDIDQLKLKYKNRIYSFVIRNSKQFNGLLTEYFNYDIDNFLHQINKSLFDKIKRMHKIERERGLLPEGDVIINILTAFKSAYYTHFRYIYNKRLRLNLSDEYSSALFYYIREYCYSSMFRYNSSGEFNVPYGGISYNSKDFGKKITYLKSNKLINKMKSSKIYTLDFEKFFKKTKPLEDDFIFLDPPYDTEFSTYANNDFDKKDQIRLANYLKKTKANFMLVIKNTDFIYDLYNNEVFYIKSFDKKYMVSFKNRNNRDVTHILVTNYEI